MLAGWCRASLRQGLPTMARPVAAGASALQWTPCRFASKASAGSAADSGDSAGRRLGLKIFGNQAAKPGSIIVRQRGTQWHPGLNVYMGRDHTIHAAIDGKVQYTWMRLYQKKKRKRRFVSVMPADSDLTDLQEFMSKKKEHYAEVLHNKKNKIRPVGKKTLRLRKQEGDKAKARQEAEVALGALLLEEGGITDAVVAAANAAQTPPQDDAAADAQDAKQKA